MNDHDTNPEAAQAEQTTPTATAGKDAIFETEIKPIWTQVWDLCQKHKINVVAGADP